MDAQLTEMGIEHRISRGHMVHTSLIGSPLQLHQIMLNLFSNAIKYNKEGGSIETYAGELSCDGKIVYYEFIITDTGVGMSREFVEEHLFKPFTQEQSDARTQYKGTGLGMSIVQGLIQKMHGSVQVESELGKGIKITCQIPFELDTESEMIEETGEISDVTACEEDSDSGTDSAGDIRKYRRMRQGRNGRTSYQTNRGTEAEREDFYIFYIDLT